MRDLEQAYQAAKLATRKHATSFYFASHVLPPSKRRHAYAVYSFCRYLDDVVDLAGGGPSLLAALESLREFVERVFSGQSDSQDFEHHPWLPAFIQTVQTCNICESFFLDLLEGVEMDQGSVRIQNREELNDYCYHVAGVVGLMMTRVFGLQDQEYEAQAIALGQAMQLTNILRDVAEDLERDRIYLPADELSRYHLSRRELKEGRVTPAWRDFMRFQIHLARQTYLQAESGIAHLPNDGSQLATWLMREIYAGILDEIERFDYDIFHRRVHTSFLSKCGLSLRALRKKKAALLNS